MTWFEQRQRQRLGELVLARLRRGVVSEACLSSSDLLATRIYLRSCSGIYFYLFLCKSLVAQKVRA